MISTMLALLLAMQADAISPTPPAPDYSKLSDAELCTVLRQEASGQSEKLDDNTILSMSVDCATRKMVMLFTSASSDASEVQRFTDMGASLDKELCDDELRQMQARGYTLNMVFDMTKLGRKYDRKVNCPAAGTQ